MLIGTSTFAQVGNEVNFQSFSGLFNVPTGETLNYGEFHFKYNNLADSQNGKFGDFGTQYTDGKVVSFSVSPFPSLEVGLRNLDSDLKGQYTPDGRVNTNRDNSDLSANIKYSPTFIPKDWFSLAVGIQDLGGIASSLDAQFVSVSKTLGDFRFTAGTGRNEDAASVGSAPRYDGGFWGVEYQPLEWVKIMAEDDGADQALGLTLYTPKSWLSNHAQIYSKLVAKNTYLDSDDSFYFGVGLRTSLFTSLNTGLGAKSESTQKIADVFDWLFNDEDYSKYDAVDIGLSEYQHTSDKLVSQLGLIKGRIANQGFENVWLGLDENTLLLRFENATFNRNDLDAIGVALGILAGMAPEEIDTLDITLSQFGVPTFRFRSNLHDVQTFYRGENQSFSLTRLPAKRQNVGDMLWIGGSKSPYWTPRIEFSPVLRNFVGTELGAYDYSLAFRTQLTLPLWEGAEFLIDYDLNIVESDSFELGQSFFRWRHDDGVKNVLLRQSFALPYSLYTSVAVGRAKEMYLEEHNLVAGEIHWLSHNGDHKASIYGAYLEHDDFSTFDKEIYIGQYRYYWESLDMSFAIEAGQFWRQDSGVKVSSIFNFGDTKVTVFTQDTDVRLFGVNFTLPLSPRRDMRPSILQVKGNASWDHSLATKVNGDDNALSPQRAYRPNYLRHFEKHYLNNDRLSVAYIKANQSRLRNAYQLFTR